MIVPGLSGDVECQANTKRIRHAASGQPFLARNMPVATKYAYTSTPTWNQMNTIDIDLKYRSQPGLFCVPVLSSSWLAVACSLGLVRNPGT